MEGVAPETLGRDTKTSSVKNGLLRARCQVIGLEFYETYLGQTNFSTASPPRAKHVTNTIHRQGKVNAP
jgi:hypothetical protein